MEVILQIKFIMLRDFHENLNLKRDSKIKVHTSLFILQNAMNNS